MGSNPAAPTIDTIFRNGGISRGIILAIDRILTVPDYLGPVVNGADAMGVDRDRFECIAEPTETWLVFDNEAEVPAMLSEVLLMSLSEDEAVSACAVLNNMERRKREVGDLA